jgi:general secretion pathway protein I
LYQSIEPGYPTKMTGFTLIEVLIALAVVSVSLAAIGSLVATNIRTTRALGSQLELVATTRAILTGLPDREQLVPGRFSGELAGHHWHVDVGPFKADFFDPRRVTSWVPQTVAVTVESLSGRVLRVNTVRLHREPTSRR